MKLEEIQAKYPCFGKQWMKTTNCHLCASPSLCKEILTGENGVQDCEIENQKELQK